MQVLSLCRQLLRLLEVAPLSVLMTEISTPTSVRPLMVGHSADTREYLRSVLMASMAVYVILDGMKQLPRPYAVIDLVPAMVCCLLMYIRLYYKIIVVCACVHDGRSGKRFDPEAGDTVSLAIDKQRLQLGDLCERQSWH